MVRSDEGVRCGGNRRGAVVVVMGFTVHPAARGIKARALADRPFEANVPTPNPAIVRDRDEETGVAGRMSR